jgi:hypothetical protein
MNKSLNKVAKSLNLDNDNLITLAKFFMFFYILFSNRIDHGNLMFLDNVVAKSLLLLLIVGLSYMGENYKTLTILLCVGYVLLLLHLNEQKIEETKKKVNKELNSHLEEEKKEEKKEDTSSNNAVALKEKFENIEEEKIEQEQFKTAQDVLDRTMNTLHESEYEGYEDQKVEAKKELKPKQDDALFTSEDQLIDAQSNLVNNDNYNDGIKPLEKDQDSAQGLGNKLSGFGGFDNEFYKC